MIHYWLIGVLAVGLFLYFFIIRAPSQPTEAEQAERVDDLEEDSADIP